MSVRRILAGLVVAGAVVAPAAQASFPYTCDTVECFATWCADNPGDCTDGEPLWYHCDMHGCLGGSGDITRYVAYCALVGNPPTTCLK